MKKKYMHLISGHPAMYEGRQIVYGPKNVKTSQMADSLDQIRKEQRMSAKWRLSKGWDDNFKADYGYIIVYLD